MEFLKNHLIDIIEIIISAIVGFLGGMKYSKVKNVTKIKGNNNQINQKGNEKNEQKNEIKK